MRKPGPSEPVEPDQAQVTRRYLDRLGLKLPDTVAPAGQTREGAEAEGPGQHKVEASAERPGFPADPAGLDAQLASAERLLKQVAGSETFLKLEVGRLRAQLDALNRTRILSVPYTVEGVQAAAESQDGRFNVEKVELAIAQALGYWTAATPLVFRPRLAEQEELLRIQLLRDTNESLELGTATGFISTTVNGLSGYCGVTIDCDNELFVDRYREKASPTGWGPFDFVALLAHEVGHAIGIDHPPLDPVTGKETERALMSRSKGEGQVVRTLYPYDIREAQRLHGALHLGETVAADFASTGVVAEGPDTQLDKGSWGMVVFGPVGTRAVLDVVVPAKGRLINSLQLKFTAVTTAVFVNRAETLDGIVPVQQFAVSARSGTTGFPGTRFELQFGFLERRILDDDMLVRLEIFFPTEGAQGSDYGVLQVHEVAVGTLVAPSTLEPAIKFVD